MNASPLGIASAFGIPGTAGTIVTDAAGALFLLSNHHVIFGGGAMPGDSVWGLPSQEYGADDRLPALVGWGRRGQLGRVTWQRDTVFVDCALLELADVSTYPDWLRAALSRDWPTEIAPPERGMRVVKHGSSTGATEGILVDIAHADSPFIGDRPWLAPGQLLIDSVDPELNFSGPGDSGAVVLDDEGRMLGLLWGSNTGGQGIASPIRPVLDCLGVAPADGIPRAESRP
jgi:hypothetical protein